MASFNWLKDATMASFHWQPYWSKHASLVKRCQKNEIKYEFKTKIKNVFPSFQRLPNVTACMLLSCTHTDRPRCELLMMLATSWVYTAIGCWLCALHASSGEVFPGCTPNLTQG